MTSIIQHSILIFNYNETILESRNTVLCNTILGQKVTLKEKGIKGIIITVEEVALTRNHIKIIYDGRKSTSTAVVEIGGTTDVISLDIWINLIRDNIGSILNSISNIGPNAVMIPYGVETT